MRRALNRRPPVSQDTTFDAPVRGWVQSINRGKQAPETATILDNWFPEIDGIRPRAGTERFAKIPNRVLSLFSYENGQNEQFFATDETNIYNITAPVDADTDIAATVTGQTTGRYSTAIMSTAGGVFLMACNGSDDPQLFNGATWSTAGITGVDQSTLSNVWSFRNRLFFIERDTMNAWYLGTEAIAGAVGQISLAGVFQRGGSLLFGATWSLDAGDGVDDLCIFVSTKGEVAVFQGSNPNDPNAWALSGVYFIGPPLGPEVIYRVGGDVLIGTEDGLVSLQSSIQRERSSMSLDALSFNIETAWRREVARRHNFWKVTQWPEKNMLLINFIQNGASVNYQFVVNTRTNAWARFIGWDVQTSHLFTDQLYFGTAEGRIMAAERTGADDGLPYVATMVGDYNHFGMASRIKIGKMAQGVFLAGHEIKPQVGIATDFKDQTIQPPQVASSIVNSQWDSGEWDSATWDGLEAETVNSRWVSAYRTGQYIAPVCQMIFSDSQAPAVKLLAINLLFEIGERSQL